MSPTLRTVRPSVYKIPEFEPVSDSQQHTAASASASISWTQLEANVSHYQLSTWRAQHCKLLKHLLGCSNILMQVISVQVRKCHFLH